jgi:putative PIN family toxin of toxin-antitoxin system
MPRTVFDAGVLVGAAILPLSVPRHALDRARIVGPILASEETFDDLDEVIRRKKFDRYVSLDHRLHFLGEYLRDVEVVPVRIAVRECRDPKDDKYLELAVSGHATHIVTGDAGLLAMHPFRATEIVSPQEFLSRFSDPTRP